MWLNLLEKSHGDTSPCTLPVGTASECTYTACVHAVTLQLQWKITPLLFPPPQLESALSKGLVSRYMLSTCISLPRDLEKQHRALWQQWTLKCKGWAKIIIKKGVYLIQNLIALYRRLKCHCLVLFPLWGVIEEIFPSCSILVTCDPDWAGAGTPLHCHIDLDYSHF